jgi:hypothetical protein
MLRSGSIGHDPKAKPESVSFRAERCTSVSSPAASYFVDLLLVGPPQFGTKNRKVTGVFCRACLFLSGNALRQVIQPGPDEAE